MTKNDRGGFSLVEVLVVIAIIGVLVALLLPAVQAARATAQKSKCASQLKQLALAIQNYESAHGVYPPGYTDGPTRPYLAWSAMLLPHLEQNELYEQVNFNGEQIGVEANSTAFSRSLAIFLCPADPAAAVQELSVISNQRVALSNYPASAGISLSDTKGMLFRNSPITAAMIGDGDTNTLLVGERRRPPAGSAADWYAAFGGTPSLVLGETQPGLNQEGGTGYSSHHAGGVHLAFCDGSVRSIPESIDAKILNALATRTGRETIPAF